MAKSPKRDKTKKGMTDPTPGTHRGVFRNKVWNRGITHPEDTLLSTFRLLTKARTSRKAFTQWEAWEQLKIEVRAQNKGQSPDADDLSASPKLFAAVAAIVAFLDDEQAKAKAGAKKAKRKSEGSRDNA